MTANRADPRQRCVMTPAQDRYLPILYLRDRQSVYLIYGFHLKWSEIDWGKPISVHVALDVDLTSPLPYDDSDSHWPLTKYVKL